MPADPIVRFLAQLDIDAQALVAAIAVAILVVVWSHILAAVWKALFG